MDILDSTSTIRNRADRADGGYAGLDGARFDDSFVRELPGDPQTRNVPRPVHGACYTRVDPTPVRAPRLLAWARETGDLLGIAPPPVPDGEAAQVLGGNRLLPGMRPYAARYGGHQFGHWAGQLGDGRAITLGEIACPDGLRREVQLKGAGRTPYSRTADGRAVLRSSVREFLCSEAMHALGVPTTRALSLVATGEAVVRDMFYDGNPRPEPGAVVCRVAPSFVRFGSFEILAADGETEVLRRLADYVVRTHFPALGAPSAPVYAQWFEEVCRRTGVLIAQWMRVGFVHGVMNTDNMSILGLTIDYGPYGWLEGFDLGWTPNTTDAQGRRYRFGSQPEIARWNLERLAHALAPLVGDAAALAQGLAAFDAAFHAAWREALADKLGLAALGQVGDEALLGDLFELLQRVETDMTLFFRGLMHVPLEDAADALDGAARVEPLRPAFYDGEILASGHHGVLADWLRRYAARVREDAGAPDGTAFMAARHARMQRANPKYVLRNYLAQEAIDALEQGDSSVLERLMEVLRHPCDEQPAHEALAGRRPEWARHRPGCSALSCSS
ncbi:YdiU family protein [Nitrosovibrio sp. Nv17]|uniref:protein adenylyltransferase SelO n=1 Tax=Nitrosovibrio sp. Nv17 TaxID=1855339 RepID=UPI000908F157|nr:YdiU family protein [Nitrosovibrio sp. Nv17]SFW21466.1 Uncharacterized conserved protein YdiU, UPF0061 family [Nitrosovibrio sp. Nv17]